MTWYNKNCHTISVNAFTCAKVQLIAHRGAANYAPENTVPSLIKAIKMGADVLEIDIRQLKTGEFVLLHDNLLNRTTNNYGFVANKTLAEIKRMDAGSWFSEEFVGETIPTLEEEAVSYQFMRQPF